jgi:hypothetical protein
VNTNLGVIDRYVANGELLVANPDTILAAIENEVAHEAAASIFHENAWVRLNLIVPPEIETLTLVSGIRRGRHLDNDIVERCRLRDLPVKTSCRSSGRYLANIDNEVANGSVAD